MQTIGLRVLLKMELPDGDVLLTDGGWIDYGAERYRDADPVWGAIGSVESLTEGIGNEVPALQMTLLPPGTSEPADLHQAGMQRSRTYWRIAEYDVATGLIVGTPSLEFLGQVDQSTLEVDRDDRRVAMSHVSTAEVLFERNRGNGLNGTFHKAIFPGELGHDEATGFGRPEAWGVADVAPAAAAPAHGGAGKFTPWQEERL